LIVLVDTTIWSLALRRRKGVLGDTEELLVDEWKRLVGSGRAALAGPIRQEVLSGIRSAKTFAAMQEQLSSFPHLAVAPGDYDRAASFFNDCRAAGIAGTAIDMLLCSLAHRHAVPIFTTDGDFRRYAERIPIRLHAAQTH
jgi:predicted nucleic acid-binding protein